MIHAEAMLTALLRGSNLWLDGARLPISDPKGIPQALRLAIKMVEELMATLKGPDPIPPDTLDLFEDVLDDLGTLVYFLEHQPEYIQETYESDREHLETLVANAHVVLYRRMGILNS